MLKCVGNTIENEEQLYSNPNEHYLETDHVVGIQVHTGFTG